MAGTLGLLLALPAKAVCPVCTVAVIGGVGLSRWIGVDDVISGIWIGGITISLIAWTIAWLDKKNIRFMFRKILIIAGYYALIVLPLVLSDISGHPLNKFWGMDKLLLGIIIGSAAFVAALAIYPLTKNKATGKPHFPLQRTVVLVAPLIILSFAFYFITT